MSFLRHEEIYPSDGGAGVQTSAPAHRLDEFPAGYSLAGWSPPEPASASPAGHQYAVMSSFWSRDFQRPANSVLTVCLSLGGKRREYLHTDKTKISKWERGEDRIGPSNDRLIRLLAAALDKEMRSRVSAIAEHLPQISDDQSKAWELHVDVATLATTFIADSRAA